MTLDGFLTFLTLVVAIYALTPRVIKLRARLGIAIQIPTAVLALLVVLYLEFFPAVNQWCFRALGGTCEWLPLPVGLPITPPQLSFLVVLSWIGVALVIHKFSSRRRACSSLPTISRIVDNLVYEKRFAEVIELVEPYLPLIGQAARRKLRLQKLHDQIKAMKGSDLALVLLYLSNGDASEREARRGAFSKKLRTWVGKLAVLVPAKRNAETAARNIARVLFRSPDLRFYVTRTRPYFAISLFRLEMHEAHDFSDAYFSELISDTGSVLYQELEEDWNGPYKAGHGFLESNRLLYFLFDDARNAEKYFVWKPIGEYLWKLLRSDESPGPDFVVRLNKRADEFDKERWEDPLGTGMYFFDLMVTAAALRGVQWHMWLFYFPQFVERLEELYDASDPAVDVTDEFPTRSARLIYEAISSLCGWVNLASDLPEDSPHRQSVAMSEEQSREWNSWFRDNGNIPVSAAIALGSCMGTIGMSRRLDDKFAGYMYEVVVRAIKDLGCDGEVGRLRSFLIKSIVHGGHDQPNNDYGQRLATLKPKVDQVIWEYVDDYRDALKQAYPDAHP